jgi:hypothetical protein
MMVESLEKPRLLCLFGSACVGVSNRLSKLDAKNFLLVLNLNSNVQFNVAFISFFFYIFATRLCLGTWPYYMPLLPLLAVWKNELLSPRLSSQALWLLEY